MLVWGPAHLSAASSGRRRQHGLPVRSRRFPGRTFANPELFDDHYTRWGSIEFMPPEVFLRLDHALTSRGWLDDEINAVISGNFMRVAEQVWPRAA